MTNFEGVTTRDRFRMLDLLRGVAVFFMIAAHSVYFFHNDTSLFLGLIEKFGNTVCFTTFLIVSAATAEIAYFSKTEDWPEKRKRLLKRLGILALGYFALTFLVFSAKIISTYGLARLGLVANILSLRDLAPFTEFFIPFLIFPLIIIAFPKFFRKILSSLPLAVIFGFFVYFLGMLIYRVPVWDFLTPWKALLFGAEGYYRFPIFQYFPVYLLGLYWGNWLPRLTNPKRQKEIAEAVLAVSVSGVLLAVIGFLLSGNSLSELVKRWPPSIPFLLIGVGFAAALALFFYNTEQLKKVPLIRDGILVFGQNALGLALAHVFLLQIYSLAGGLKTGSIVIYLVSFVILVILSIAIAAVIPFNFRFALCLEKGSCNEHTLAEETLVQFEEEAMEEINRDVGFIEKFFFFGSRKKTGNERLIKRRHILGASITFALATFIVFPPIVQEYQMRKFDQTEVAWELDSYGYRNRLALTNSETLAEIPADSVINCQFDHAALVSAGKAYPDGRDLYLRYYDGKKFQDVNFWLSGSLNSTGTGLTFKTTERIKPGDTNRNYYLYFGNNLASPKNQKAEGLKTTPVKYSVKIDSEESYPILLTVSRRWTLLDSDPKYQKDLKISLKTIENFDTEEANFSINNTKFKGKLEKTGEKLWEGVISTEDLKPGSYEINASIEGNDVTYKSSKAGFFVSYPLYVAWTQDWEGYDVSDVYLSAMQQMSKDHGLVMTHFWNPRLSTTDSVTPQRKETLENWVKKRRDVFGETIQLHLHMFNDFVSGSGVNLKTSPNWGDSGDGYGTLTTNYSAEEMTRIIKKGISVMQATGFGTPTIYRAGGWFANSETLKAVKNAGMLADSSGRTSYKFFSQVGPWNLPPTAQPYYPSQADQNKSGEPLIGILEIPNNGADSYWFSSDEMQARFYANYAGGVLGDPKQITYLSHPQWFNKNEQAKIEGVFNLVDQYKYDNDYGPAVYVTLDKIYEVWTK